MEQRIPQPSATPAAQVRAQAEAAQAAARGMGLLATARMMLTDPTITVLEGTRVLLLEAIDLYERR